MAEEAYHRILLKLSGEALLGQEDYGIDPIIIHRIAVEIGDVTKLGIEVAVVIGGGNIFRGAGLAKSGIDRVLSLIHISEPTRQLTQSRFPW